ncbi:MAG: SMP-30/gluconolactonase/LRE family protein [Acidimicrobiia bacterium]
MRANSVRIVVALVVSSVAFAACTTSRSSDSPTPATTEVILTDLRNPRGVAVDAEGGVLVAEAGLGDDAADVTERTGRLTRFIDRNNDGDFGDPGEIEPWFEHLASYNAMNVYATGRDEVSGPSDIAVHGDGRVYLSIDGGFDEFALLEISADGSTGRNLSARSNMTGIALARDERSIFATESTLNQLIEVSLETGDRREVVVFSALGSDQQAVPAGLAIDPRNGDVLVALFSGVAQAEDGSFIPFVVGDAKVVRVDPDTGAVVDEISGLTTAVDVAIDEFGNIFVVEMAADYAELFEDGADLEDPNAAPRHGGYVRFSGAVTVYPQDGGPPRVLVSGLDAPTNITLGGDGALYVSTGQGTPGRPIPGPDGPTVIVGHVLRITGF